MCKRICGVKSVVLVVEIWAFRLLAQGPPYSSSSQPFPSNPAMTSILHPAATLPTLLVRKNAALNSQPVEDTVEKKSGPNEDGSVEAVAAQQLPCEEAAATSDVCLSREDALRLQRELMVAFSTPAFQRELHELGRLHAAGTTGRQAALLRLVRSVQVEIIPRFGFAGSEAGLASMLRAFRSLEADPDVSVNSTAIRELLSLELPSLSVPNARMVVERPCTKHRVLDLLRVQLIEFSKAAFQLEVETLKRQAAQKHAAAGFYHLPGRAELALLVQETLLPQYGFAASKDGVREMIQHCAPFAQDQDVAGLLDRINETLGMSPEACQRFRDLLADF